MNSIDWFIAVHLPLIFGINFYYGRALLLGIACAHDEQHRMTPLSPWYFFMHKFKWHGVATAACIALCAVVGCIAGRFVFAVQFAGATLDMFLTYLGLYLAWIGSSCAVITVLAPRFREPMFLAIMGTLIGPPLGVAVLFLLRFSVMQWIFPGGQPGDVEGFWFFTLPSLTAFCLTWHYVRFKLDRAWFRFED